VEKELAILQQLHHPHLVSFMFIADQGSRISIIMDWAGENLRVHRTVTQAKQYTEDVARHMMYQLTSALVYLHAKVCVLPGVSLHHGCLLGLFWGVGWSTPWAAGGGDAVIGCGLGPCSSTAAAPAARPGVVDHSAGDSAALH
jgi:hypothetical protein